MATFIPLGDPLREILLIFEAMVLVLSIQMGLVYVRKFFKKKSNFTILAWGELLFAYSVVYAMYIVSDFYIDISSIEGMNLRVFVLNISYVAGLLGVLFFSYNLEREIKYRKHIISIIMVGVIGFLIINMVIPMIETVILTVASWLIFIVLIIIYIKRFTAKISEKWRVNVYSLIIGVILVILGFGATADVAVAFFGGIWMRLLGDCLVIAGILLISVLFIGVPSLSEFDWHQKVKYLNVIHNSGVSLAAYSFNQEEEAQGGSMDELLMAGGLTSISQIISDIIESDKHLDLVDHGDVKIIFEFGKYLINVLIADEDLEVLRGKLKKFTDQIEFIYDENLARWDGDLGQFEFLDPLVKAYFKSSKQVR